jgi:hypothetical protein
VSSASGSGVTFYDPFRLAQDLEHVDEMKEAFVTLPGLLAIPRVTRDYWENAIRERWKSDDFFDYLARLKTD